jgi:hypothetical protein
VRRGREGAATNLVAILADRLPSDVPEIRKAFGELGGFAVGEAEDVVQDENLTVTVEASSFLRKPDPPRGRDSPGVARRLRILF